MDTILIAMWELARVASLALACWALVLSSRGSVVRPRWHLQEMVGRTSVVLEPGQAAAIRTSGPHGRQRFLRLDPHGGRLLVSSGSSDVRGRRVDAATMASLDDTPLLVSRQDSLRLVSVPVAAVFAAVGVFVLVWSQTLLVGGAVTVGLLTWLGVAAGLCRWFQRQSRPVVGLMCPASFLVAVGVMVQARLDEGMEHLIHAWMALGAFATVAAFGLRRGEISIRRGQWLLAALGLQLMSFVPGVGVKSAGSTLSVELAGFAFQPSEPARILLIGYFGAFIAAWRFHLRTSQPSAVPGLALPPSGLLLPLLTAGAVSVGVQAAHRDFGPSVIFYGSVVAVAVVVTGQRRYATFGLVGLAGGMAAVSILSERERERVLAWLGRGSTDDFQLRVASASARRGGLFGVQPGELLSSLETPLVKSDMVLAATMEIGGIFLVSALGLAFGLLVASALAIYRGARGTELGGVAAALGLAVMTGAALNAACFLRLFPLTGVPLPFVSAGGSSLVSTWLALGFITAVSGHVRLEDQATGGTA